MNPEQIQQARFNMVEQQIRTWEVLDQSVLDMLFKVKREDFVPLAYRSLAFADMEIPLAPAGSPEVEFSPAMMAPKMEARIIQEVSPQPGERALEIGTGSGYLAALLAQRAQVVHSIEYVEAFSRAAAAKLATARIGNVRLHVGDAARSASAFVGDEKFDVIVLTGSVPVMPQAYLDALKVKGRLFAVVGDAPVMEATLFLRTSETSVTAAKIFETVLTPLIHAAQPSRFHF